MPDTFRTFVAIELPHDVRAQIIEHIARLRREVPNVRASWSREQNLHLTLKFLGNVAVADVPKVSGAVERAAKACSGFDLTFSGCGTFPPRGRPNVLWIGVGSSPEIEDSRLETLQASIDKELAREGFPRESRAFHPHLTVARLRASEDARRIGELHRSLTFAPLTINVSEVVVFRSELLKEGSKHPPISRHQLARREDPLISDF